MFLHVVGEMKMRTVLSISNLDFDISYANSHTYMYTQVLAPFNDLQQFPIPDRS